MGIPDTHPTAGQNPAAPVPVVIQVPLLSPTVPPQANPLPVPAPQSQPTSAPTSAPTQPPQAPPRTSAQCALGRGTGDGHDCPRTSPMFLGDVEAAIDRVMRKRPELFNGNAVRGDWNVYYAAVVDELRAAGFCAIFDGEEVAVKNTNSFNEQYHVLTSGSIVRKGEGAYRATCWPAWF